VSEQFLNGTSAKKAQARLPLTGGHVLTQIGRYFVGGAEQ